MAFFNYLVSLDIYYHFLCQFSSPVSIIIHELDKPTEAGIDPSALFVCDLKLKLVVCGDSTEGPM